MIDDDFSARLGKASASFGRLTKCLWNERCVCLSTKINVYCAVVLTTLLYGCEAWTPHRRHIRRLDQFHMRCLRQMARYGTRTMRNMGNRVPHQTSTTSLVWSPGPYE